MCLVENAQHEKIFAYIQQQVCANKATRQLFCSSLLFCFRELNRFLELTVRDPQKILRVSRNSKLDPRNLVLEPRKSKLETRASKLDSRKLRGSRIEFRVETVNLHLNGTVYASQTNPHSLSPQPPKPLIKQGPTPKEDTCSSQTYPHSPSPHPPKPLIKQGPTPKDETQS